MPTRQEIIAQVVGFYERGGQPGYDLVDRGCSYFVTENKRCALGAYITADKARELELLSPGTVTDIYVVDNRSYEVSMCDEMYSASAELREYLLQLLPADCSPAEGVEFLEELQRCHDGYNFTSDPEGEYFLEGFKSCIREKFGDLYVEDNVDNSVEDSATQSDSGEETNGN